MKFIAGHKGTPFFLYLAHTFPHVPLFASGKFSGQSRRGLYGDVVEEIDWSVGQRARRAAPRGAGQQYAGLLHQRQRPLAHAGRGGRLGGPLRDGKGSTWEGGMRGAGHRLVAGAGFRPAWLPTNWPAPWTCLPPA